MFLGGTPVESLPECTCPTFHVGGGDGDNGRAGGANGAAGGVGSGGGQS